MKLTHSTLAALAAVLFLALPTVVAGPGEDASSPTAAAGAAQAEGKKKEKGTTRSGVPFRGLVGSVDSSAQTVTLSGKKKERVLHVNEQTRLERDGKVVALGDIKPGDYARGSVSKDAEGREVLLKAAFGEPPADTSRTGASAPETARNGN